MTIAISKASSLDTVDMSLAIPIVQDTCVLQNVDLQCLNHSTIEPCIGSKL